LRAVQVLRVLRRSHVEIPKQSQRTYKQLFNGAMRLLLEDSQ